MIPFEYVYLNLLKWHPCLTPYGPRAQVRGDRIMKKRMRSVAAVWLFGFCVIIIPSCDLFDPNDDEREIDPYLGRGYDVSMKYADPECAKSRVLDVVELDEEGLVEILTVNQTSTECCSGETVEEYLSTLSVAIDANGKYMCFSASVSTNFATGEHVYKNHSFATMHTMISRFRNQVPQSVTTGTLKSFLLDTAKHDINDTEVPPETLFDTYGTHVMTGVITGARLDFNIHCDMSRVETDKKIDVFAQAAYNGMVTEISGSTAVLTHEEHSSFIQNGESHCTVVGGNSQFGNNILANDSYYDKWVESIDENSTFCGYADGGLRPIWDFADSQDRRDELEAAFQTYIDDKFAKIPLTQEPETPDRQILAKIFEASHGRMPGYALYGLMEVPNLAFLRSADDKTTVVDLLTNKKLDQVRNVNDRISSAAVVDGYVLSLYHAVNYGGEVFRYVGVVDQVRANDDASSLKIKATQGLDGNPVAVVYNGGGYTLDSKSYYTEVMDSFLGGFMHDKISSVRILNPAFKVILYEAAEFGGRILEVTEDLIYVGNDFNDKASSLKVVRK